MTDNQRLTFLFSIFEVFFRNANNLTKNLDQIKKNLNNEQIISPPINYFNTNFQNSHDMQNNPFIHKEFKSIFRKKLFHC